MDYLTLWKAFSFLTEEIFESRYPFVLNCNDRLKSKRSNNEMPPDSKIDFEPRNSILSHTEIELRNQALIWKKFSECCFSKCTLLKLSIFQLVWVPRNQNWYFWNGEWLFPRKGFALIANVVFPPSFLLKHESFKSWHNRVEHVHPKKLIICFVR